jgi:signal peptidase I
MTESKRTVVLTGFGVFLLFVLAFAVFFWANFHTVVVRGESMEPTLDPGQRVLVSKAYWLVGPIDRSDVVVLQEEGGEVLIKRVVGLPGDKVDFALVPRSWRLAQGEYHVPEDSLYVVGDNRPVSQDSRDFGPFAPDDVIGKVVVFGGEPWLLGFGLVAGATVLASWALGAIGQRGARRATA